MVFDNLKLKSNVNNLYFIQIAEVEEPSVLFAKAQAFVQTKLAEFNADSKKKDK